MRGLNLARITVCAARWMLVLMLCGENASVSVGLSMPSAAVAVLAACFGHPRSTTAPPTVPLVVSHKQASPIQVHLICATDGGRW